MKYIGQFAIIMGISFLGELCKALLPLPIPASIYGLLLMLGALMTGIIKLDKVESTAGFLIEIMPLMFIPAAVGLLAAWSTLKPIVVPIILITFVSTIVVMAVSGFVTQWAVRRTGGKISTLDGPIEEDVLEEGIEHDGVD